MNRASLIAALVGMLISYSSSGQLPTHPIKDDKALIHSLNEVYHAHPSCYFSEKDLSNDQENDKTAWSLVVNKQILAANRPCYHHKICLNKKGERFKGLSCCKQNDSLYNVMLYDLHNRIPVPQTIAHLMQKSHFDSFDAPLDHPKHTTHYGVSYYPKYKILVPPDKYKGEIARIILYMNTTYGLSIPKGQLALYHQWHQAHPASYREQLRNKLIAKIQGNLNPYV